MSKKANTPNKTKPVSVAKAVEEAKAKEIEKLCPPVDNDHVAEDAVVPSEGETEAPVESRTIVEAKAVKAAQDKEAIAAAKKASPDKANPDTVLFVSAMEENTTMIIRAGGKVIKSHRDKGKKFLCFRVPKDVVKNFEMHEFVKNGRIIKAK